MLSGGGDSWLVHVLPWAAWSYLNETKTCAASGLSCSVADLHIQTSACLNVSEEGDRIRPLRPLLEPLRTPHPFQIHNMEVI